MEVEIEDKELLKLYQSGKSRKYRLHQIIIDKFLLRINLIMASNDIYDLWNDHAAKFKKLEGKNKYSMRLNNKYRLEMKVNWENDEKTLGTFLLTRISKHYE